MIDSCICCGSIIPEGRQICPICENKIVLKKIQHKQDNNCYNINVTSKYLNLNERRSNMFKEYFEVGENGAITGMHNTDGIDDIMLATMQVLNIIEGENLDYAIALIATMVQTISEKNRVKASDFAFKVLNILLKYEIEEVEKRIGV